METAEILNCRNLNVFTGQNNAGKSNILLAIQTFFSYLPKDSILFTPKNIQQIDFFNRATKNLINITFTFALTREEVANFLNILSDDLSNIKVTDEYDSTLNRISNAQKVFLSVTMTLESAQLGFLSEFSLTSTSSDTENAVAELILCKCDIETAKNMENFNLKRKQIPSEIDTINTILKNLDGDKWEAIKGMHSRRRERRDESSREDIEDLYSAIFRRFNDDIFRIGYENFVNNLHLELAKLEDDLRALSNFSPSLSTSFGVFKDVPRYIKSVVKKISSMKVLYQLEEKPYKYTEKAKKLLERGKYKSLQNIQQIIKNLTGKDLAVYLTDSSYNRIADIDIDEFEIAVNGAGIKDLVGLILNIELEKSDLILLEEPELHLHPALEMAMVQYLRQISSDCQIFLTTHSTSFLNVPYTESVYLAKKNSSTTVQLLDIQADEQLILSELGLRLSSLFMADSLVFVEGKTDVPIIRTWASTLNIDFVRPNVGFILMDGSRNINNYAAVNTLSFLKKRQMKLWFLLDKDEREKSGIFPIKTKSEGKATLCVLNRREIENYLICPRAILELIKLRKSAAELSEYPDLSEDIIEQEIQKSADTLKEFTINKMVKHSLCKPLYWGFGVQFNQSTSAVEIKKNESDGSPFISSNIVEVIGKESEDKIEQLRKVIGQAQAVYDQKSQEINDAWNTQKLALVPGDELLKMVLRKYGIGFDKGRDGLELASLMKKHEIDEEVQKILRQIGGAVV